MRKIKNKTILPCVAALMCAILVGCGSSNTESFSSSLQSGEPASEMAETGSPAAGLTVGALPIDPEFSDRDLDGSWDDATAAHITLTGEGASIDGVDVSADGQTVTIQDEGVFVFSGALSDGQIIVDAQDTDKVQIVLNGVDIKCGDGPAIYVKQADKVFITLAEGSENTLSDGAEYELAEGEDEPNACVFSKDDLTINGSGALLVTGNYDHGIRGKDDLKITGGNVTVTAVGDAIKGKDCVAICAGTFDLTAGGDGIQSSNDTDASCGWVSITGGSFTIDAGNDGIQAETTLQIGDGTFDITTGGGAEVSSTSENAGQAGGWGVWQNPLDTTEETSDSAKALKASQTLLYIAGGEFTINASDDALHSNGDVTVAGGGFTIATGDDGLHADGAATVSGGTVDIIEGYEGIEGLSVVISGGEITLKVSDDGLNAAGGNDSSGMGFMKQDAFGATEGASILISGGKLTVDAGGDGLDSNGSLTVTGGETYVWGPTNSGNGALDYAGEATVSGGVLVAVGSTGMAQGFGANSTQYSAMINASGTAGVELVIKDADGNAVITCTPAKDYQNVVFTCPALADGEFYTLTSGGTELCTVALSGIATNSGGMGGMGGMGGGRGQGWMNGGTPPDMPSDGSRPSMAEGTTPPEMPSGGMTPPGAAPDGSSSDLVSGATSNT